MREDAPPHHNTRVKQIEVSCKISHSPVIEHRTEASRTMAYVTTPAHTLRDLTSPQRLHRNAGAAAPWPEVETVRARTPVDVPVRNPRPSDLSHSATHRTEHLGIAALGLRGGRWPWPVGAACGLGSLSAKLGPTSNTHPPRTVTLGLNSEDRPSSEVGFSRQRMPVCH